MVHMEKERSEKHGAFATIAVSLLMAAAATNLVYTLFYSVIEAKGEEREAEPAIAGGQTVSTTTDAAAREFPELGEPARFKVPALGIDTEVLKVGMSEKGRMIVPKSYDKVAWYRHGPYPGNPGNSVIAGHFDNGLGQPAVFHGLSKLKPGDEVQVTDQAGRAATFRVVETRLYDYDLEDTSAIFGPSQDANLNLITCDGAWIQSEKTYDKRYIVFTERVS